MMAIRNNACFAALILILAGCSTIDQEDRRNCTRYEEEVYTQNVCVESKLDCDYNLSGQQLCRTTDCAREEPRIATRQVCMSYVCKEGYVRHPDGSCYTPEEMSRLQVDPDQ